MTYISYVALILLTLNQFVIAKDHLIPDTDIMADPDDYKPKLRERLSEAFAPEVFSRVVVVRDNEPPKAEPEYAVALKTTRKETNGPAEYEVFVLELSARLESYRSA